MEKQTYTKEKAYEIIDWRLKIIMMTNVYMILEIKKKRTTG